MGYTHCDEHDEDATNGCAACASEGVDAATDAQIVERLIHELAWPTDPVNVPLVKRGKQIAERLEKLAEANPRHYAHYVLQVPNCGNCQSDRDVEATVVCSDDGDVLDSKCLKCGWTMQIELAEKEKDDDMNKDKQETDPDDQHNCVWNSGNGEEMPPYIVELHSQLHNEVERLTEMMRVCVSPTREPSGYVAGYKWISTEDKNGERSEFSKRLAKARALFEGLIAMAKVQGIQQDDRGGPDPKNAPPD